MNADTALAVVEPIPQATLPESFEELAALGRQIVVQSAIRSCYGKFGGLELGRLVSEFAQRPEIVAETEKRNSAKRGKGGTGGRPLLPYCLLAERLAPKIGIRREWIQECVRAYRRDEATGGLQRKAIRTILERHKALPETVQAETVIGNPGRLAVSAPKPKKILDAKAKGRRLRAALFHFIGNEQFPRIPSKEERTILEEVLSSELGRIDWSAGPNQTVRKALMRTQR